MAHIQKRNGKWQARYRGPDGRERTARFDRKVDAQDWLDTNSADITRGQWVDPAAGKVIFGDWAERWKAMRTDRPSTVARDVGYLERYLLPTFGDLPLSAIDYEVLAAWLATLTTTGPKPWWNVRANPQRQRKPVSPATAVKAVQILGRIMDTAVRAKKVHANPVRDLDALPRVDHHEMRFLTAVEVERLAESVHPRYRALVLVGAHAGLRMGELTGLRRHRVDVLRSRLEVAEICTEVSGQLHFGPPKTRAGRRTVSLPRSTASALGDHLANYTEDDPGALVFTAPNGGPLRLSLWRRRYWSPAVRSANLTPLRPHDMRHTAVALWIAAGANALEVARRAGHTKVSFTLDRYGHLMPDADAGVAERLEELIAATPSETGTVTRMKPRADKPRTAASGLADLDSEHTL